MIKSVTVKLPEKPTAVNRNTAEIIRRALKERCGEKLAVTIAEPGKAVPGAAMPALEMDPQIGREAFRIADGASGAIRIIGGDERGLLYGAGKFLRACRLGEGGLEPCAWRGVSAPEKPFRCIYFATHFHNWYQEAPVEKVERYVEELALWGYNCVSVWFDMHHYTGIDDPAARDMLERLHRIFQAANAVGLGASLCCLANEAYAGSPEALRADWTAGHDGYTHNLSHYHVELCPNKPGATALMLKWREEMLAAFADIRLDYLVIWPYDQGGCTCSRCKPWGANGYLKMAKLIARLGRRCFPNAKIVFSTWCFDLSTRGEWAGLARAFRKRPDWVDYIMADGHTNFPEFPLKNGIPGGLPLVGFPEISMFGAFPWGGFGANPFPARLQRYWDKVGSAMAGGAPYSEGIFEDLNKVVCACLYWGNISAAEAVREYIAYEFSPEVATPVMEAIRILEETLPRTTQGYHHIEKQEGVEIAYALIRKVDARLPPRIRSGWRWRILFLRATIDRELLKNKGVISDAGRAVLGELVAIYHAQNAQEPVRPPQSLILKPPLNPPAGPWRVAPPTPKAGGGLAQAACPKLPGKPAWPTAEAPLYGFADGASGWKILVHDLFKDQDGIVYIVNRFKFTRGGSWILSLGHDGGAKVFVDGKEILCEPMRRNPIRPDRSSVTINLTKGTHEVMIALDTDHGNGWGIILRFLPGG
ncbi:MAG: hypothetical protein PHW60_11880 [Kiritimatiellae bacterium]|nr:hypothetical protein [Kiritimatiellia bacterium]